LDRAMDGDVPNDQSRLAHLWVRLSWR